MTIKTVTAEGSALTKAAVLASPAGDLDLVGRRPSLDFVNSVSSMVTGEGDRLNTPVDLIAWAVHAGLLDTADATIAWAERHPREAASEFADAIAMRAAIYRVMRDLIETRDAAGDDLALIATAFRTADAALEIVDGTIAWVWKGPASFERIIWRTAFDAVDVVQSEALDRLHQCDGPSCTWTFVDTSRSGRRKWCSMRDCGNRAKVRAYRQRHQDESTHSPARTTP
jgi:predicted RNA-binding Zn ribbon-like protein